MPRVYRHETRDVKKTLLRRGPAVGGVDEELFVETCWELTQERKDSDVREVWRVVTFGWTEGYVETAEASSEAEALAVHSRMVERWKLPGREPQDEPVDSEVHASGSRKRRAR